MNKRTSYTPRRSKAQWKQLIDDHRTSDLTVAAYCETHGVSSASFYHWRSALSEENKASSNFIELSQSTILGNEATCQTTAPTIELELGNGMTLKVYR